MEHGDVQLSFHGAVLEGFVPGARYVNFSKILGPHTDEYFQEMPFRAVSQGLRTLLST